MKKKRTDVHFALSVRLVPFLTDQGERIWSIPLNFGWQMILIYSTWIFHSDRCLNRMCKNSTKQQKWHIIVNQFLPFWFLLKKKNVNKQMHLCSHSYVKMKKSWLFWNVYWHLYETICERSINFCGLFIGVYMREQWVLYREVGNTTNVLARNKNKPGSVSADVCKKETLALLLWY